MQHDNNDCPVSIFFNSSSRVPLNEVREPIRVYIIINHNLFALAASESETRLQHRYVTVPYMSKKGLQ